MSPSSLVHIGLRGDYHWLEVEGGVHLGMVVQAFPELVFDQHLAITACDSGIYRLSEQELQAGWETRNGIAYSPRITDGSQLQFQVNGPEVVGFDEWYVFDEPRDVGARFTGDPFLEPPDKGRVFVFVNFFAFRLNTEDPSTDFVRDWFWQQVAWMQPRAYLADGRDCFFLVTKDGDLVERVVDYLYDIVS
jgi:hypothetical protein